MSYASSQGVLKNSCDMTDDSAQVGDFDIYVADYLHKTFGRAKPRKGRRIAQAQD